MKKTHNINETTSSMHTNTKQMHAYATQNNMKERKHKLCKRQKCSMQMKKTAVVIRTKKQHADETTTARKQKQKLFAYTNNRMQMKRNAAYIRTKTADDK